MARICLVRHTTSVVDPNKTADLWDVAIEGHSRASALIPALEWQGIDLIVTSPEYKARVTGEILAQGLHLQREEAGGLSEQSWSRVPFLEQEPDWIHAVRSHFESPEEAVFGEESSRDAALRFDRVVADVLSRENPPRVPAFVSHGRIMCAWLAMVTDANAFDVWQSLRMPDAIMVDLADRTWSRITPPEQ